MGLRDQVLRQRREAPGGDMEGVFIAEGDIVIERALRAGYRLRSLLIDARRNTTLPEALQPLVEGGELSIYAASRGVLQEIAGYHSYRGALGCFDRPARPDPTSCDPLARRCCRVSMGEGFTLPHARLDVLPDGLDLLRQHDFTIMALTPRADAVRLDDLRCEPSQKVALCLGAEGPGLTDATIAAADLAVRIPMSGSVDSINVGTAAAVAFYGIQQARRPRADPTHA